MIPFLSPKHLSGANHESLFEQTSVLGTASAASMPNAVEMVFAPAYRIVPLPYLVIPQYVLYPVSTLSTTNCLLIIPDTGRYVLKCELTYIAYLQ